MSDSQRVKDATSIVDIASKYCEKLEQRGNNFVALCPFHREKTASFHLYPDTQTYYCFGCGVKGDVFSFIMEKQGLDFRSALLQLAKEHGVTLSSAGTKENSRIHQLKTILERVFTYYIDHYKKGNGALPVHKVVQARGFTSQIQRQFGFGYAPQVTVQNLMAATETNIEDLMAVGLVRQSSEQDGHYLLFRDRLMLPIRNARKEIVGFVGRALHQDAKAKYLNSPETILFKKNQLLFGADQFVPYQRWSQKVSIIVEGQLDVIAMHQAGFTSCVAPMGTALNAEHITYLFRRTDTIVLLFDGDSAGIKATGRSLPVIASALSSGKAVRIALMDKEHDPDSLLREEGKQGIERTLDNALSLEYYFIHHLRKVQNDSNKLAAALGKVRDILSKVPDSILRELILKRVGDIFEVQLAHMQASKKNANPPTGEFHHGQSPLDSVKKVSPHLFHKIALLQQAFVKWPKQQQFLMPPRLEQWWQTEFQAQSTGSHMRQDPNENWKRDLYALLGCAKEYGPHQCEEVALSHYPRIAPPDPSAAISVAIDCMFSLMLSVTNSKPDLECLLETFEAGSLPRHYEEQLKKLLRMKTAFLTSEQSLQPQMEKYQQLLSRLHSTST